MSLTQIIEKEKISTIAGDKHHNLIKENCAIPKIYSPKLDKYVPIDSGNLQGEIQKYNIGMGPGSWY